MRTTTEKMSGVIDFLDGTPIESVGAVQGDDSQESGVVGEEEITFPELAVGLLFEDTDSETIGALLSEAMQWVEATEDKESLSAAIQVADVLIQGLQKIKEEAEKKTA